MEKDDKGSMMIRMGVSGWMFLLVPAYPGCPGSKAVKRSSSSRFLMNHSNPVDLQRWMFKILVWLHAVYLMSAWEVLTALSFLRPLIPHRRDVSPPFQCWYLHLSSRQRNKVKKILQVLHFCPILYFLPFFYFYAVALKLMTVGKHLVIFMISATAHFLVLINLWLFAYMTVACLFWSAVWCHITLLFMISLSESNL